MRRPSELLSALEDQVESRFGNPLSRWAKKLRGKGPLLVIGWYIFGMLINSLHRGILATFGPAGQAPESLWEWNPILNFLAVFTPFGLGLSAFLIGAVFLFSKKGYDWLAGEKATHDPRGFDILPDGTHGTGGWMTRRDMKQVLEMETVDKVHGNILGKLPLDSEDPDGPAQYVARKPGYDDPGHILIYGSSGTGKSRGVIRPLIFQGIKRRESLVVVDSRGDLFESTYAYAKEQGYTVRVYNTLDPENGDGCNFLSGVEDDPLMVQTIAEVIIKSTSNVSERQDFWEKAEKNLLMALLLYVQTLRDPVTGELLARHRRSIPAVYRMLSTESFQEIDDRFSHLPANHPALPPYGIFKLANRQIWGNVAVGLGNRLAVFQNPMLDRIASYDDIDLELPGRQPCVYYCIISDHDSTLEFMSSLFFSLMFSRLINYARRNGQNGRLPVRVNMVLDEFCNIYLNDAKRLLSVVRARNIFCQLATQGISQLSDRYPHQEWEEIVANCDTQIYLGGNDLMTANYLSEKSSKITVRTNSTMTPMEPLLSPFVPRLGRFAQSKSSAQRPLMLPDEILSLDNRKCLVLLRGQRPLQLYKIAPEELPGFAGRRPAKATDYVPRWKKCGTERPPVPVRDPAPPAGSAATQAPAADLSPSPRAQSAEPMPGGDGSADDNLRPYTSADRVVSPEDIIRRSKRIN